VQLKTGWRRKWFRLTPHRHLPRTAASNGNTVFVRKKAEVETRVKEAPRFKLVNGEIYKPYKSMAFYMVFW
jgi:hypothetical protein